MSKDVKPEFDNTGNGALFAGNEPNVLTGPLYLTHPTEPDHTIVCTVGPKGTAHHTTIYRRDKKTGLPIGRAIGHGELIKRDRRNADAPCILHVFTTGKKVHRQVGWVNKNPLNGDYIRLQADTTTGVNAERI